MQLFKLGMTALILSLTLLVSHVADSRRASQLERPLEVIPEMLEGCTGSAGPGLGEYMSGVLKATSYLSRNYDCGDGALQLLIVFYARQRAGESMHSPKVCLPGSGWEILDYGKTQVSVRGAPFEINRYSIQRDLDRMRVLYWYQTRHHVISDEYVGKLLLVRDALWKGTTGGSIVRITFRDRPGLDQRAARFAARLIPEMGKCLGQ